MDSGCMAAQGPACPIALSPLLTHDLPHTYGDGCRIDNNDNEPRGPLLFSHGLARASSAIGSWWAALWRCFWLGLSACLLVPHRRPQPLRGVSKLSGGVWPMLFGDWPDKPLSWLRRLRTDIMDPLGPPYPPPTHASSTRGMGPGFKNTIQAYGMWLWEGNLQKHAGGAGIGGACVKPWLRHGASLFFPIPPSRTSALVSIHPWMPDGNASRAPRAVYSTRRHTPPSQMSRPPPSSVRPSALPIDPRSFRPPLPGHCARTLQRRDTTLV
jgi:hypothetical protein